LEEEAKLRATLYPPHILIKKASSSSMRRDSGLCSREQWPARQWPVQQGTVTSKTVACAAGKSDQSC